MVKICTFCYVGTRVLYGVEVPSVGNILGVRSRSKGDFAIKLTAMVEARSHTGYLALVRRRIDKKEM